MDVQIPSVLSAIRSLSAQNAAPYNVGVFTNIVSINVGLLVPGQLLLMSAVLGGTKGAIAGTVSALLTQTAGTATVNWLNGLGQYAAGYSVNANDAIALPCNAFGIVTVGGTFTVDLGCVSVGSNLVGNIAQAQMRLLVIER